MRSALVPIVSFAMITLAAPARAADGPARWPHWRGPAANGAVVDSAPLRWNETEHVRWRRDIPGRGFSTPVVWGRRLFLTTAVPTGNAPEDVVLQGEEFHGGGGVQEEHAFEVMCLDRHTGAVIWRKTATTATPHEGYHKQYGSFASISPVTDGDRLWTSFGSFGLYCWDLDGKLLWKTDPGVKLTMRRQFGEGCTPVVHDGTLVHVYDHEGQSFIVALDAATGEARWRRDRDEPSTWATPLVTEHGGRTQVIVSGTNRVRSYDLKTGALIWACGGIGLNAIPSPLRHEDIVIAMSGYKDANILAVRLGGTGDLTGTDAVVWTAQKGTAYTAQPVLHDGLLYTVLDRGLVSCFDAATGTPHYLEQRLPRGSQVKASPLAAGGRLYVPTESGDVHVVRLGPAFEVLRTNTMTDQFFVASPVAVGGDLILRSRDAVFCIVPE